MSLGDKLKTLRLRENRTLKEQSGIFNVSMNSVYRWEHNLAVPRMPVLKAIADFYKIPLEWFFLENTERNGAEHGVHHASSSIEQQLVNTFRKISDSSKYKVLGYLERMCIEEYSPDEEA